MEYISIACIVLEYYYSIQIRNLLSRYNSDHYQFGST